MEKTNIRKTGILLHPASFPSHFAIGDFGEESRKILDSFKEMGISLWQILPMGPTGYGNSPYSARSCFAGNEYLIDLRSIPDTGKTYTGFTDDSTQHVDYKTVYEKKLPLLKEAALLWLNKHKNDKDFVNWQKENNFWLPDYCLYMAISNLKNDSRWFLWEEPIRNRKPDAVKKYSTLCKTEILIYTALQYLFYSQWQKIRKYANSLGISIIGDIPIFVSADSADIWCNRKLFKTDADGLQTCCAGCPPDAFDCNGQFWGNPVYDWEEHKKENYNWWKQRIAKTFEIADIVRIDHFRGFESYWEIPQGSSSAKDGKWVKGPGTDLLSLFKGMNIIAEDLGDITPAVKRLLKQSGFPGMKILEFAFEFNEKGFNAENPYLPHNYNENCVVYTGTHDNRTLKGWYTDLPDYLKDTVRRYFECPDENVQWNMIKAAIASPAKYAVIPIQDILGQDDSCRMNTPSTVGTDNWSYRYNPALLENWMKNKIKEYNILYGRNQ